MKRGIPGRIRMIGKTVIAKVTIPVADTGPYGAGGIRNDRRKDDARRQATYDRWAVECAVAKVLA